MPDNISYNYLDLLNPQQRAAVVYDEGPSLVIAGAGSGKTRVLTYKIVDLLTHGYEPWRILALTFTNKAAREMKDRVAAVVGEKVASQLWMGTFHSVFLRILRRHADLLGYQSSFTIYDAADSRSLIKAIVKDFGLDEKVYKPATLAATISNAKNALISAKDYAADSDLRETDKRLKRPMTYEIYKRYESRCRLAQAMDFDDILFNMNVLLRDHPDVRRHYQEYFRYILVDEYQDTNFSQHLVVSQLAGPAQQVCVVGDDAQSIYSFRGANIDNILTLEKRYPGLRIFKLERNYRSTQNIVNAAGSLIAKNKGQMPKKVFSEKEEGEPVKVIRAYSDLEEGYIVATHISQSKMMRHDSFDDYAVLYRTNAQSRVLEESLRKRNIPYRIYGGLSFYQRKEVKDAIAYFRLTVNPDDDEALRRVINYPARGIGETTMKKLSAAAAEKGVSVWQILKNPLEAGVDINSGTLRKLSDFARLVQESIDRAATHDAYETGAFVIRTTGLLRVLEHDNTPESISKQENLQEILTALKDFVDSRREEGIEEVGMSDFLSEVSLATDQDEKENDHTPKVTLMTVHAAKGLEFKHVVIVGVEEDLFPSAMSKDSAWQVEEERRLLYVAITRAEETCTMTYAAQRMRFGETSNTRPSRFLTDIDRRFLEVESSENIASTGVSHDFLPHSRPANISSAPARLRPMQQRRLRPVASSGSGSAPQVGVDINRLNPGVKIRHGKFGEGRVVNVEKKDSDPVAVVDFVNFGTKKLLLRFARFEIID